MRANAMKCNAPTTKICLGLSEEIRWSLAEVFDGADGVYRTRFLDLCESVPLGRTAGLFKPGRSIDRVYFPVNGFVCLLAHESETSVALKRLMDRYVAVVLNQSTTPALRLRFGHLTKPRRAHCLRCAQMGEPVEN